MNKLQHATINMNCTILSQTSQTHKKTIIFHLFEAQKQAKRLYCVRITNVVGPVDIAAGRGHTCMGLLECW